MEPDVQTALETQRTELEATRRLLDAVYRVTQRNTVTVAAAAIAVGQLGREIEALSGSRGPHPELRRVLDQLQAQADALHQTVVEVARAE